MGEAVVEVRIKRQAQEKCEERCADGYTILFNPLLDE